MTTIEIDPQLAAHACAALATTGFGQVRVITGDGTVGHPARAPYDRIISTVAVTEVPYAWVAQTRPGSLVLTPWANAYYPGSTPGSSPSPPRGQRIEQTAALSAGDASQLGWCWMDRRNQADVVRINK